MEVDASSRLREAATAALPVHPEDNERPTPAGKRFAWTTTGLV
jgi:hypothetical protein